MAEENGDQGTKRARDLDNMQEDDGDNKRIKTVAGEGPSVELRFLMQSKNAGAIIGKGGSNIKRLRQDFKATVTVPDSEGPERILTVGANLGTACEIINDIIPSLEDVSNPEYRGGGGSEYDSELRMLIHQSQAGCIIGRAGFKIKELREETGSQIKVYSQCCPESTERVVSMQGKPHTVVNCIASIIELLESAPPKGFSNLYDPNNFDEYYAQEYGGFTSVEGGMAPRRGGLAGAGGGGGRGLMGRGGRGGGRPGLGMAGDFPPPMGGAPPRGGGLLGRGGPRGGMGGGMRSPDGMGSGPQRGGGLLGRGGGGGRGRGGDGFSFDRPERGGGMGGGRGGGGMPSLGGGAGSMGGGMASLGDNFASDSMSGNQGMMFGNQSTTTTQVSIPKDLAGAIIGKGGSRIRQIRQESGAGITIDEAQPGSTDRIITITGAQDQIQNAQYLLQMSVKQYSGRY